MAAMAEEEPPVTRDEVRGWFDDLEFTKDTAFSLILDQAEQQYRCEFHDGMSKEAKSIHDWLFEKWDEKKKPRPPRKARTHKDTFTIIQFNQQQLTMSNVNSEKRVKNLGRTIWEMGNTSGFAACVMQEVLVGGGEEAIKNIVDYLNTKNFGDVFRFKCSGVVNPMGHEAQEKYAIIYNERLLGPVIADEENGHRLMTHGIEQLKKRLAADGDKAAPEPTNKIGNAILDLTHGREIWSQIGNVGGINTIFPQFDRMPALFSFNPPGFDTPIHILAAHSATLNNPSKQNQNIVETMMLQEICIQAADQGEYVILLGDFNIDETGTERLWNKAFDLHTLNEQVGNDLDEKSLLNNTRERFLDLYYRGVNPSLPTNVYPFLSGKSAEPKHNDDIWVPVIESPLRMDKPTGRINTKGNKRPGKVHKVPEFVLEQWDKKTREYFESIGSRSAVSKTLSRRTLNNLLSKLWSDHRPVSVTLKRPPPAKETKKKKDTVPEEVVVEDTNDPIVLTLTQVTPCVISDYDALSKYFLEEEIEAIRNMQIKEYLYYEVSKETLLKTLHMDGSEEASAIWDAMSRNDVDPFKELKVFFDEKTNPKALELVENGGAVQDCGKIGCACDTSFMRRIEEFIEVGATESLTKLMA